MKLALLADIHGNHLALQAVLTEASVAGVERLLVAGDMVGYYFEPRRVIELLGQWKFHAVRGNHEVMLCRSRSDPEYLAAVEGRYGSGVRIAMEQLSHSQLDELCGLPHPLELEIDGLRVLLCHGAPWSVDQYIYPTAPDELTERCAAGDFDLVVMGHTHYPMVKVVGRTVLLNPGSVGQSRNRVPGAHWASFDTDTCEVRLHCVAYDVMSVAAESRSRHPDLPYLSDVLERR